MVRLYGDESTSADPYALFEPYRGEPLREVGANLFDDEFDKFLIGLLTGLCWLAGAGIAHRAISPDTVWWDGESVLITDFSRSAPFGTARTPLAGSPAWIARESRPDTCYGIVGPTDDVWAAVRLIYFVRSRGQDLEDFGQLAEIGLAQMFNGLLGAGVRPPGRAAHRQRPDRAWPAAAPPASQPARWQQAPDQGAQELPGAHVSASIPARGSPRTSGTTSRGPEVTGRRPAPRTVPDERHRPDHLPGAGRW